MRVYKPLPFMNKKPFLAAALGGKSKEDKIKYFSTSRRIVVWRKKIQRKRLGGLSEEKQATDEIQKLVDAVSIADTSHISPNWAAKRLICHHQFMEYEN